MVMPITITDQFKDLARPEVSLIFDKQKFS